MSGDRGVNRRGRPGDGGHYISDDRLMQIARGGVVGFFGLLLLVFVYPPLTARIRGSSGVMLAFVLVLTLCITPAVAALVLLNRRN